MNTVYFWQRMFIFYLLPFYIIFNEEFVGPDAWEETLGPRLMKAAAQSILNKEEGP
jgi:hypothetical protein